MSRHLILFSPFSSLIKSKTGSGKTLAYLAPALHLLQQIRSKREDGTYGNHLFPHPLFLSLSLSPLPLPPSSPSPPSPPSPFPSSSSSPPPSTFLLPFPCLYLPSSSFLFVPSSPPSHLFPLIILLYPFFFVHLMNLVPSLLWFLPFYLPFPYPPFILYFVLLFLQYHY